MDTQHVQAMHDKTKATTPGLTRIYTCQQEVLAAEKSLSELRASVETLAESATNCEKQLPQLQEGNVITVIYYDYYLL